MLKLFVLSACIACVLAGVLPKPPASASHDEEKESPSVKKVPLHADHHPSMDGLKKSDVKQDTKKVEEKSVKKDHHEESSLKKYENKDGQSLHAHAKIGNIHSLGRSVEVAPKIEAMKPRPAEKKH